MTQQIQINSRKPSTAREQKTWQENDDSEKAHKKGITSITVAREYRDKSKRLTAQNEIILTKVLEATKKSLFQYTTTKRICPLLNEEAKQINEEQVLAKEINYKQVSSTISTNKWVKIPNTHPESACYWKQPYLLFFASKLARSDNIQPSYSGNPEPSQNQ